MVNPVTGTAAATIQGIYYHSLATLALSLWDFLTKFEDEVHYIWPMKRNHAFKWLYIFHRHFLLAAHIVCQITLYSLPAVSSSISLALVVFLTILTQCTDFTLEVILAFRLFALFGRRPWISRLLGCLILADLLCCIRPVISYFKWFGGGILYQLSPEANIQVASTTVMHSTFITLAVVKHISIVGVRGVGRKVISQFTLDGIITFLMMMGLLGLAFTMCTARDSQPIILLFWALAVHSICGSRLILGMACIQARIRGLQEDESIMLTTHIDICLSEDLD